MAEVSKNDNHRAQDKKREGLTHISYSEFSLFNQCPQQHLIFKHLGLDMQPPSIHLFFGNSLHEAIEMTVKQNLSIDARVKHFRLKFKTEMMDNLMESPEYKETENFLNQGEEILRNLDINAVLDGDEINSVEEELYENLFGKFHFKGFIDVTSKKSALKRYRITDWKTSGEPWDVKKKLKDEIFLCQMRFYKYFWGKKNNIPLDQIDCRYVVLNRLKNKKDPQSGFGGIQIVDINSTKEEIFSSLKILADTVKKIHILKEFPKVKFFGNEKTGCMFCKYKGGVHPLCNSKYNQYVELLAEHKKIKFITI